MAALKPIHFKHTNEAGETLEFSGACGVSQAGEFHIQLPAELATTANALCVRADWKTRVKVGQERVHWRVTSTTLDNAQSFVKEVLQDHLGVETTEELVICYWYESQVAYWENADGSIVPNGYWGDHRGQSTSPSEDKPQGSWGGTLDGSSNSDTMYRLGFAAKVFKRITHKRSNYTKVVFERPESSSYERGGPLDHLNSFIGLWPKPNEKTTSVPYSDEAAVFFSRMLIGMCEMSRRLGNFLGDKEAVVAAIARNDLPLIGG